MRVRQVGQHIDDLDRAVAFYESFFESPVTARFDPPGLAFFALEDVRLLLDKALPSSTIYFGVDDVASTVERLRAEGVAITSEPHVIFHHDDDRLGPVGTDEWMAFFQDSEGNVVGLTGTR